MDDPKKKEINTGGPAFPQPCDAETCPHINCQGMTLRDWFAGQALAGMLSKGFIPSTVEIDDYDYTKAAYIIADSMLEAREQ